MDDELAERIARRLHDVLDRQALAGFSVPADRGLGLFGEFGDEGVCILSIADVARIAAQEAREPAL